MSGASPQQRNATSPQPPPKPAHLLTGNAVPKPYTPFPTGIRSDGGATVETHTTIVSPINANRVYETSTLENYKLSTTNNRPPAQSPSFNKATLEACVQDLHQKTFGKTGVVPLSSFKTTNTTNTTTGASPVNGQGNFGEYR